MAKAVKSLDACYNVRTYMRDLRNFMFPCVLTMFMVGWLSALIPAGIAGAIITTVSHHTHTPTHTQTRIIQLFGCLGFMLFGIPWSAIVWKVRYHFNVSEAWKQMHEDPRVRLGRMSAVLIMVAHVAFALVVVTGSALYLFYFRHHR